LTTPHRHSHDQNHKHDRGRHHDHDDACANREHDKSGAHASLPSTVATAYLRLGLTARETEVLRAAAVIQDEADIAWELFLSLHAVRERLARLEAKLWARTATDAVARALHEST
jgi:ATP/maltotriose-dependent transcriptional regulator MalT